MGMTQGQPAPFDFDNSYARLPERFFARQTPQAATDARIVHVGSAVARLLRTDPATLRSPFGASILGGGAVPDGADPLAMAYAGHQFGNFVPQLGDGRAILLGEIVGPDGIRRDVQLKGGGPTPFSRNGDGRAALGPVLRELIVSEAMAALGIPTTRALAVVTTGTTIMRDGPKPGAVLTRVAESHVRVGTFQFLHARGDVEGSRILADYVIARHYPALAQADHPYAALLEAVVVRTASLVAQWMLVGFIHGVMNTDNMSIAGETIDYGPCAFMDNHHPARVYSSIDLQGRYAFANQPHIAHWNMTRLAEVMLPLLGDDSEVAIGHAQGALDRFADIFNAAYRQGLCRKLGLTCEEEGDLSLAQDLLGIMKEADADFTQTFRALGDLASEPAGQMRAVDEPQRFAPWLIAWRARLAREPDRADPAALIRRTNPAFIARNHLVAEALAAAEERLDFAPLDMLLKVIGKPFDEQPDHARYGLPPRSEEVVTATFCGT